MARLVVAAPDAFAGLNIAPVIGYNAPGWVDAR